MNNLVEIGERIQGASFLLGQCSGIDIAARWLRNQAGDYFADSLDGIAKTYRSAAAALEQMEMEMRRTFEEGERQAEEKAFEKLALMGASLNPKTERRSC